MNAQRCIPNLKMFTVPENRQGRIKFKLNCEDKEMRNNINNQVSLIEKIMDKDIIPNQELSIISVEGGERGYYEHETCTIILPDDSRYDIYTLAHEMGHYLNYNSPSIRTACGQFYEARTEGEPLEDLGKVLGKAYTGEKYRKDNFSEPYCGKLYSDGTTEILSKGIELLVTNPIGFYKQDREYYNFVRCILSGKFKNYKKEDYQ